MKNLTLITITLFFAFSINNVAAQKKKVKVHKGKHGQKTVVHKGKNGKKTVIHKGKNGKKTVIKKNKHGKVKVYKPRRRFKRTRVVHYHYRHLPRRGAVIASVHVNAINYRFGGIRYRFHRGVWYKPYRSKWIVVRPAFGIRVKVLPVGYRRVVVGPTNYYYYYGTYYVQRNNEYEVVEAPLNAEIGSLPDGYNTINVDGEEYYELDGVYYMPSVNENEEEVLVVVENPTK